MTIKKIYISQGSLNDLRLIPFGNCKSEYLSVEWLKKWVENNKLIPNATSDDIDEITNELLDELLIAINEDL